MNPLMSLLAEPLALDPRSLPMVIEMAHTDDSREEMSLPQTIAEQTDLFDVDSGRRLAALPDDGQRGSVIAVVPLTGVVTRHGYGMRPGTAQLAKYLRRLDADPAVSTIVIDVDSPGGSVYGTAEASDTLFAIRQRGETKTIAVADPLMASAATWIATAASEVYAIGSADVGSIGVVTTYTDQSRRLANLGIDVTIVRTPDKKARFTSVEPLTDAMKETMESRNQSTYQDFVSAMARNRGVSADDVEKRFGGGEVMGAREAVAAGLIDGIASLDEVIDRLLNEAKSRQLTGRSAAAAREIAILLEKGRLEADECRQRLADKSS